MWWITALLGALLPTVQSVTIADATLAINGIPFSTRAHWMRHANAALQEVGHSACPFAAFGTAIVNHTGANGLGDLVCIGANQNSQTGNPSLHGNTQCVSAGTDILVGRSLIEGVGIAPQVKWSLSRTVLPF